MSSRVVIVVVSIILMSACASPLRGQVIRGTVLDGESGLPIPSGTISLLTEPGQVAARVQADSSGAFEIRAPEAGTYYFRAESIGYRAVTQGVFELGAGGMLEVEVSLIKQPIQLEGVEAIVARTDWIAERQRKYLEGQGFYDRKEAGFGYFVEVDSLVFEPFFAEDLFRRVPGVSKIPGNLKMNRCEQFVGFVNGIRVFQGASWDIDIDVDVGSIAAVEIYPGAASLPLQYGGFGVCAAVLIWTR